MYIVRKIQKIYVESLSKVYKLRTLMAKKKEWSRNVKKITIYYVNVYAMGNYCSAELRNYSIQFHRYTFVAVNIKSKLISKIESEEIQPCM